MNHLPRAQHYWQSLGLLLVLSLCCVFPVAAESAAQTKAQYDTRARFVELDGEIQAIKEEILEINRDILALEEMAHSPQSRQLVVLVSVVSDNPVYPESIALRLDGQSIGQHRYTSGEVDALKKGGVHRLYTGAIGNGEHLLEVAVSGKLGTGRALHQQHSTAITKARGRKYLELRLGSGGSTAEPVVTFHEWQR